MTSAWSNLRDQFDDRRLPTWIAELWQGDPATLRLISRDYNIVYRFEAAGKGMYLRICHPVLHPLPKARQALHFLRFLAQNDVPVGRPLPSTRGQHIELLADGYYAAAQLEAPGEVMTDHLLDISVYEAWGCALGKLHAASRNYQPNPAIDYTFPTARQFWQNITPTVRASSPELRRAYADLSAWMHRLPPRDYGLIHGDYRPGNVIWDGETARAIDFDEPNFHWYIADVARALMELSNQPHAQRRRFRQTFMRGYLSEHQIDEWWLSQLPCFAQHRGLLMHMWTLQEGGSGSYSLDWALKRLEW